MQELLQNEHRIEYVKLFNFGKRVWVRIACQIYNELDDYARLADAVLAILSEQGQRFVAQLVEHAKNADAEDMVVEDGGVQDEVANWDGNYY